MNQKSLLLALLVITLELASPTGATALDRPNVLLIISDDLTATAMPATMSYSAGMRTTRYKAASGTTGCLASWATIGSKGTDRDLLIGGWGSDRLIGNAADDILIAGWTAYDTIDDVVTAILTGSGQQDWFFFDFDEDEVTDEQVSEQQN